MHTLWSEPNLHFTAGSILYINMYVKTNLKSWVYFGWKISPTNHIYSGILGIYWFMQYMRLDRMGHAIDQFLFNNPCLQAVMTTIQNLALIICVWCMASSLSLWPLVHTSHYLSIKEYQHKPPFIGSKKKGEAKK